MNISVFGLGYVGVVAAGCLAADGHHVAGVDPNAAKVDLINRGVPPIVEGDIAALIESAVESGRLRATADVREAVLASDLSLVCVGTPSQINGALDLRYVRSEAVARNEGVRVSFYNGSAGQCYAIHTGSRSDCRCDSAGLAQCVNGAVLLKSVFQPASQPVKVVANVGSMLFNADNGTTVPGGTICVVPPTGKDVRHTVNIMGRVKSCSRAVPNTGCGAC